MMPKTMEYIVTAWTEEGQATFPCHANDKLDALAQFLLNADDIDLNDADIRAHKVESLTDKELFKSYYNTVIWYHYY